MERMSLEEFLKQKFPNQDNTKIYVVYYPDYKQTAAILAAIAVLILVVWFKK
jgi:hypothetical protein